MEPASDEFIYQSRIPNEPPAIPAQTLEINGQKYILDHRIRNIKIVSHRYSPLIPMSVDEQAVPPEVSPSMAANIPQMVYDQLSTQFSPAAKNLGNAAVHLSRSYYVFQEAMTNFCDATHKLIKSADTAGHKSKNEARELSVVLKQFATGVNGHQKIITEFDALAHKIHDYSGKEKEKLKAEFGDYKAKEKKIVKRKNGETDQDVAAFYRTSASSWAKQQELRYKFFNDKIHSWINGYAELAKSMYPEQVAPQAEVVVGNAVVQAVPVAQENHHDWHHESHETAAQVIAKEADEKKDVETSVDHRASEARSDSTSSVATTIEDLPSSRRLTNDAAGVTLVSSHRRQSIEIVPVHPVAQNGHHSPQVNRQSNPPVLPPKPVEQVYAPTRPAQRQVENPMYAHPIAEQVPQQPVASAPGGVRRAGNTIPGAVNVFGFANQSNPQPHVRYTPVQNGAPYQVMTSDQIRVGRVVDNPVTEEQMNAKKFHVDANYNPSASPSHQVQQHSHSQSTDISVPSFFNPSQYGSILIVNDDFNASSGEQMTVNRGDKVILLKCGSRGWVFVRDSISNRTGWVPEPYVNP